MSGIARRELGDPASFRVAGRKRPAAPEAAFPACGGQRLADHRDKMTIPAAFQGLPFRTGDGVAKRANDGAAPVGRAA